MGVNTTIPALTGGAIEIILMIGMITLALIWYRKETQTASISCCGSVGHHSAVRPNGDRTCRMCHPADEPYWRHNTGTADEYDLFIKAQAQPFIEDLEAGLAATCEQRDSWKETALSERVRVDDLLEQLEEMEQERDDYEQQRDELLEQVEEMEMERDEAVEAANELAAQNSDLLEKQLEQRSNPSIDPHVLCALFARMPSEWVANILTNVLIEAIVDPVQTTLEMYE